MPDVYPKPTARPVDDFGQYIGLLLGAIDAELARPAAWSEDDREDALYYIDDLKSYILDLPERLAMTGESHLTIWHNYGEVVGGNAIARTLSTSQPFGFYAAQSPAANNDQFRHIVYLDKGAWQIRMLYAKATTGGQVLINVSGVGAGGTVFGQSVECWSNPGLFAQTMTGDFVVSIAGKYEVYGQVTGKNASSGSYVIPITAFSLWRYG